MPISITTSNKIFDKNQNLLIVLAATFNEEITTISKDNYVFIYENKTLVGINIFDYHKELSNIKTGYHDLSQENYQKILEKYPNEMKSAKYFSFFKIGIIQDIKDHPKSSKLWILSVKFENEDLNIITNLSNLSIGKKYLFAIKKAFLATGIIIEESKTMGIVSQGMICSYKSIGIDQDGLVDVEKYDLTQKYTF